MKLLVLLRCDFISHLLGTANENKRQCMSDNIILSHPIKRHINKSSPFSVPRTARFFFFFSYSSIQKRCYCQHSCQNVSDPWQAPLVKTPASAACSAGVHGNLSACIVFNRCFRAKHSVQWVSPTNTPFTEVTWDVYNNYKGKM